jgi:antitoxin MazE
MATAIRARLVKVGNSQTIRIPKTILQQLDFSKGVELEVQNQHLIVRPVRGVRQNWATAFKAMHENGEDQMLDPETPTNFDKTQWHG